MYAWIHRGGGRGPDMLPVRTARSPQRKIAGEGGKGEGTGVEGQTVVGRAKDKESEGKGVSCVRVCVCERVCVARHTRGSRQGCGERRKKDKRRKEEGSDARKAITLSLSIVSSAIFA